MVQWLAYKCSIQRIADFIYIGETIKEARKKTYVSTVTTNNHNSRAEQSHDEAVY
jgi:6-phosphofructokinase